MTAAFAFAVLCLSLGTLDALPFNSLTATMSLTAPQPCCFPDQLEYSLGESVPYSLDGKGGLLTIAGWVAVDYKAKKITVKELVYTEGQTMNLTTYGDLGTRESYVVDWDKKQCSKSKLPSIYVEQCLPKDAQYVGTIKYGLGQTLSADEWSMHIKDEEARMDLQVFVTMTSDSCVPVAESIIGRSGNVDIAAGLSYFDFKDKITDPSIFDVPAICKKGVQGFQNPQMATAFQNHPLHKMYGLK